MTGPDRETVMLVLHRDGYRCVVCSAPCQGERGWLWSLHHRRGRDGKPDSHSPQNLITVCGGSNVDRCHGRIHARRFEADACGWWISRNQSGGTDPLRRPVLVERGTRWVLLGTDGEYHDVEGQL